MRKTAVATLIFVCLMASGLVYVQPIKAQFLNQNNVTINADGTVTPSTAPVTQTGNLYTLTTDFAGSIAVNRSNTVVDGKNHALSGGLLIQGVSNVTVKEFVITDGEEFIENEADGILLDNASQITVANNTISSIWSIWEMNGVGFSAIDVWNGSSNVFTGNSFLNDAYGIYFSNTQKNLIVGNIFVSSTIAFGNSASNNTVYHNNFIASYGLLVNDGDYENPDSMNVWDNGYPDGGNYWTDYASYGAKEIDSSGIGNKPYIIDTKNSDRYPLMQPFNSTFFAFQVTPPTISIESPINQTYSKTKIPLDFSINVFSADKTVNWIGYSLDGQQNVTLIGNSTLIGLSSGLHSVTVYANDTFGNMGASETFTFNIPRPFPTTLAVAAVALVVLVGAGLFVYFKRLKRVKRNEDS